MPDAPAAPVATAQPNSQSNPSAKPSPPSPAQSGAKPPAPTGAKALSQAPAIQKVKAAQAKEKADGSVASPPVDEVQQELPKEPQKVKFKSKFGDKEEDVELTTEEIQRDYQKWKAGDKKLEEAAKVNKQNEVLLEWLHKNPLGLLEQMGVDVDRLAAERINKAVELEMMNPDARKAHELQQKLERIEQEQAWRAQQEAQQQSQFLFQQQRNAIQTDVMEALTQSKALPPTQAAVARVAQYMMGAMENGQDIPTAQAIQAVSDMTRKELSHYVNQMDGKTIYEWIGPNKVKELQAYAMSLLKRNPAQPKVMPDQTRTTEKPVKILTDKTWDNYMRKVIDR